MVATVPAANYAPATLDEILTYECAKSVAGIVNGGINPQIGPVFYQDGLVFTSLSNSRGEKMLVVDAGMGIFTIPLNAVGVNRMRFTLPINSHGETQTYFLGYIHGERYRSRALELTIEKAPIGRDDLDYQRAHITRSENLLPHLEYAVFQTTQTMLSAISAKRLTRQDLNIAAVESCDHISRRSPSLARNMRFDLEVIVREILGPKSVAAGGGRMPASVVEKPSRIFKQN